jgi:hypothetical protein
MSARTLGDIVQEAVTTRQWNAMPLSDLERAALLLLEQRDALLEACREIVRYEALGEFAIRSYDDIISQAFKAIAKAEEV